MLVADLGSPELDGADARHLRSVLRLRPGEPVGATDGRGGWRLCLLGGSGDLEAAGEVMVYAAPSPPLTVAFAPVKGYRSEWAVQKLTEIGVERILLMRTDRAVVQWEPSRAASHLERLARVARQALMQSRGLWIPRVEGVVAFGDLARASGLALAAPGGSPVDLAHPTVLVGPEGGWSERELAAGLRRVSLGANVMRTETAAVAAGVLLAALREGVVGPAAPRSADA